MTAQILIISACEPELLKEIKNLLSEEWSEDVEGARAIKLSRNKTEYQVKLVRY